MFDFIFTPNQYLFLCKKRGNNRSRLCLLLLALMISGDLLSKLPEPVHCYKKPENRDVPWYAKYNGIHYRFAEPHPDLADSGSSYLASLYVHIIEPSVIYWIIQREKMPDEIKQYDSDYIKTNKIKRLQLLTTHSKRSTGEDSIGVTQFYDFDTSGNILQFESRSLRDKDFSRNDFLYTDGKLSQIILTNYTAYNNSKTTDTFLVITDRKNNIAEITPLSRTSDRCLASYSLLYNSQNQLESVRRTVNCKLIDTTWTQFNRDQYGDVVHMTYGKCCECFLTRDNKHRIRKIVENDCVRKQRRMSNRRYNAAGNLRSIRVKEQELDYDFRAKKKIYLKYNAFGLAERHYRYKHALQMTTKITYVFF